MPPLSFKLQLTAAAPMPFMLLFMLLLGTKIVIENLLPNLHAAAIFQVAADRGCARAVHAAIHVVTENEWAKGRHSRSGSCPRGHQDELCMHNVLRFLGNQGENLQGVGLSGSLLGDSLLSSLLDSKPGDDLSLKTLFFWDAQGTQWHKCPHSI